MVQDLYIDQLAVLYQRMRRSFSNSPFIHGNKRLGVLCCSDGRMRTFNRAIGAQPGMLYDMRAVGARKSFLSYAYRDRLGDWIRQGGTDHVMLLTYHFDCLNRTLGCAGFRYETACAIQHQLRHAQDIHEAFDGKIQALVVGYDTRLEQLHLHGAGQPIMTRELIYDGWNRDSILERLSRFWPHVSFETLQALLPLVLYNAQHVADNISNGWHEREVKHREVGLVIGRRVGWIVDDEDALQAVMIEDTTMEKVEECSLGISLLRSNLAEHRIPLEHGAFLFVCIPYISLDARSASVVAGKRWMELAQEIVLKIAPDVHEHLVYITGVISEHTRELSIVDGPEQCIRMFPNPS